LERNASGSAFLDHHNVARVARFIDTQTALII
jgi:hypothetical protein